MKKIIKLKSVFYLFLFTSSLSVVADNKTHFELGEASFNSENYSQAVAYFKKALAEKPGSPSINYSLGSTYYRLKDYDAAKKHFSALTDNTKYSPLAYYNLGLVANKQNNKKLAIANFEKSASLTRNKQLRKLANRQIASLNKKPVNNISGYVSLGAGHDSNITSAPDGVASNQSGNFARALALGSLLVSGKRTEGFVIKGAVAATNYFGKNFNDDRSLGIDLSLRRKTGKWRLAYDAGIKQSTYSGEDFQRIMRFTIGGKKRLDKNHEIRLRFRHEDIESLNALYDYLDGNRQRLRAEYRVKEPKEKLRFLYELELNDRQNTLPRNYSPTRHKFAFRYDKTLDKNNRLGGEIEYRKSDYEPTATQDRSDTRWTGTIKHVYKLDKDWKIKSQLKHKSNDSNEPLEVFDYDRTIISLDLSRTF